MKTELDIDVEKEAIATRDGWMMSFDDVARILHAGAGDRVRLEHVLTSGQTVIRELQMQSIEIQEPDGKVFRAGVEKFSEFATA